MVLYDDGEHKFIMLRGMNASKSNMRTNVYLIAEKNHAVLIDPGSAYSFFHVYSSMLDYIDIKDVKTVFYSHQDPDVISGMTSIIANTDADIYVSKLWSLFISYFSMQDTSRIKEIPDSGMTLTLQSGSEIEFIPAHFLHSPGNFSLYDKRSGILYSGDIGTSVDSDNNNDIFVKDFYEEEPKMKYFHRRYMHSNAVCRRWVKEVKQRDIKMIAPQHGKILTGENINRFLNWLSLLQCGADVIYDIYPKH